MILLARCIQFWHCETAIIDFLNNIMSTYHYNFVTLSLSNNVLEKTMDKNKQFLRSNHF